MKLQRPALCMGAVVLSSLLATNALAFQTFGDGDRSSELTTEADHQQYQFNTPTTVTYDPDSLTGNASQARVYAADMGNHRIQVLDLDGKQIGRLDDVDQLIASDSPHSAVPAIQAPLGIAYLSLSEAQDDRLAGLYVNDVGLHQIHFFRTSANDPDKFEYVTSIGQPGHGGGTDLTLPRNLTVTPQGFLYVSDEFNHRVKVIRIDPDNQYQATLIQTLGSKDGQGTYQAAGPIIRGVDKNYGVDSAHYDDYSSSPEKREGFRIPQGVTYYLTPDNQSMYVYITDNGSNRIKIYKADVASGTLTLADMLGRFINSDSEPDHLKRPRGVRTDHDGNLYIADSYNGRILKFENTSQPTDQERVRYRADMTSDAHSQWEYGSPGIHQVLMRSPATAATEDAAFQLPNDHVPLIRPDGSFYRENVWAWGYFFSDARVHLVSDTGNHRIKKCWSSADGQTLLRCSTSAGVGGTAQHEFWGHPRSLPGQLHSASGMTWLNDKQRLLVSDTPNTRINIYDAQGQYRGRFTDGNISYGVTGISVFKNESNQDRVMVLVASDATLPWPYIGDSSLRIYDGKGDLKNTFNLGYRTGGLSASKIAMTNANYPVSISVGQSNEGDIHPVYITSFGNHLWRFDYNETNNTLAYDWHSGDADPQKGTDLGDSWLLGSAFFDQGAPGTFDEIGGVAAVRNRVFVTDRRNQRVQVYASDSGALLGQLGKGGGTYDHPISLNSQRLFLPAGVAWDEDHQALLVADGFSMLGRAWAAPDQTPVDVDGQIRPNYLGHWLNPTLGTRPGGLFDAELITSGGGNIFIFSLISNRVTQFDWSELNQ
jgi:hypothetical protein